MKAPISMCCIVRDDPILEQAIASLLPHVEEVCVCVDVDAPATIKRVESIASNRRPGDGRIIMGQVKWVDDFAHARAESFSLARQPFVGWFDSDDVVEGAEHLAREVARVPPNGRLIAPYDYAHDEDGHVTRQQWRERVVPNDGSWRWEHPTHESLTKVGDPYDPSLDVWAVGVRWVHKRTDKGARGRSLAILEKWSAAGHDDAWTHLNLGVELQDAGRFAEAAAHFARHFELSAWDDERVISALKASECALANDIAGKDGFRAVERWVERASSLRPGSFEVEFARAKLAFTRAVMLGEKGAMREVVARARAAAESPETRTPLGRNPLDRGFAVWDLMRVAAECERDWPTALEATERALSGRPAHPPLVFAQKQYRAKLDLESVPLPAGALDIVFACPSEEPFDGETPKKRGIGGSETAVVEVAKRLAALGHRVRVYCNCVREGTYDGVDYADLRSERVAGCDVLVSWRTDQALAFVDARVRVLWVHDIEVLGMGDRPRLRFDRLFALSEFHKRHLCEAHKLDPDDVYVTRNGVDMARFEWPEPGSGPPGARRDPHRAVWSSSPDRGLMKLLDLWPRVRERVPDAELHAFYSFDSWRRQADAQGNALGKYLVRNLENRARTTEGVTFHGRVDQATLAREMTRSGVWCCGSWFLETSCVGAIEAQAAGCRVVASPIGAMPETAGRRGTMVEGDWFSEEYDDKYVDAIVEQMISPGDRDGPREYVERHYAWDGVAEEWDSEFRRLLAAAPITAMPDRGDRKRLRIMLSRDGTGGQRIDPRDPAGGNAGGGGKAGFLGLARALGRLGKYEVECASLFVDRLSVIDGVRYVELGETFESPDIAVGYYDVRVLQGMVGPLRIGLHHTLSPYLAWQSIDVHTAPSEYARRLLRETRPRATWRVLPNAVEGLEGVKWSPEPGRVVHHTSPDRGLYNLLERWGEIRDRVPHATLRVVGSPERMIAAYAAEHLRDSFEGEMSRRLKDGMRTAREVGGVKFLGPLPRWRLLEELSRASCFAAPFEVLIPCETWSISIHECCAVGVPVALAPVDALAELWGGVVACGPSIGEDRGEFVDNVVRCLTDADYAAEVSERQRAHVAQFSFDRMARDLDRIIEDGFEARRKAGRNPVPANGEAAE